MLTGVQKSHEQRFVFNRAREVTGVRALPAVLKASGGQAWPAGMCYPGAGEQVRERKAEISRQEHCSINRSFIFPVGSLERLSRASCGHLACSDLCSGQGPAGGQHFPRAGERVGNPELDSA